MVHITTTGLLRINHIQTVQRKETTNEDIDCELTILMRAREDKIKFTI